MLLRAFSTSSSMAWAGTEKETQAFEGTVVLGQPGLRGNGTEGSCPVAPPRPPSPHPKYPEPHCPGVAVGGFITLHF